MKVVCPECRRKIASSELNVARDLAHCTACGDVYVLSELMRAEESIDLDTPPKGVSFTRTRDGFRLQATTRSAEAFFLVPFMCVWSGGSLGGLYGSQIVTGQFDFLRSLFGIPFLLGSVVFWATALMAAAGKVVIEVSRDRMTIFTGVGPVGRVRRLSFGGVRQVRLQALPQNRGRSGAEIALEGKETITFGSGLNAIRQSFVERAIRRMLTEHRPPRPLPPGALSLASEFEGEGHLSHPDAPEGALSTTGDER